jgi:hypothetical protein
VTCARCAAPTLDGGGGLPRLDTSRLRATFEAVIDASGVAPRIEAMLPIGVRPR